LERLVEFAVPLRTINSQLRQQINRIAKIRLFKKQSYGLAIFSRDASMSLLTEVSAGVWPAEE
jgi:hypothetical protein